MTYQIGDFSRISRLSIKTLHFYHECGLLEPTAIDPDTGYRYYDERCLSRVRIIQELKALDFPLKEIRSILESCRDDADLLQYFLHRQSEIKEKIKKYHEMQKRLERLIRQTPSPDVQNRQNSAMPVIKEIDDMLITSIRYQGKYQDMGLYLQRLYKVGAKNCCGSPLALYYDHDYKEVADIEVCIPVNAPLASEDIKSRVLKGGKALSAIHKGPYQAIGETYKILIDHIRDMGLTTQIPSREIYLKGYGLILPRSPKEFITEVQMMLAP